MGCFCWKFWMLATRKMMVRIMNKLLMMRNVELWLIIIIVDRVAAFCCVCVCVCRFQCTCCRVFEKFSKALFEWEDGIINFFLWVVLFTTYNCLMFLLCVYNVGIYLFAYFFFLKTKLWVSCNFCYLFYNVINKAIKFFGNS